METLARLIIGKESKNAERRDFIWNMIGSFLYALASMVLSIAVVAIAGADAGGVFTFAYSTFGQHMFMVAYFGIRPFQITDTAGKYSFGDYFGLRLGTCAFAVAFGAVYIAFNQYSFDKGAVIFLMVVYKVIDALADTFEAEFQRQGMLHLTGKSNTFRTIISVTVFLVSLEMTKDLVPAAGAAVIAQIVGFLIFDAMIIKEIPKIDWKSGKGRKFALLKDNTFLFFSVILDFYIFSAAKYAIEAQMTDSALAVFGAIFMPTSVINLVAGFVIRPFLTKLSVDWEIGRLKNFTKTISELAAVIAALTVLAVFGAWLIGIPVLSLLYPNLRAALAECRPALVIIILGGALNAFMNLFYYSLIIMQKQKFIFGGYIFTGVLAVLISGRFVRAGGIFGGSVSYMILMATLAVIFLILAVIFIEKRKTEVGKK